MAVATGQRTTGNVLSSQRTIDISDDVFLLEADVTPLLVISRMATKAKTSDPLFSWLNDAGETRFDAVNNGAGYADNATSVVVDTGTLFAADDVVFVPRTGELISVTSISTNTLTVVRGVAGSTAAALVDNDPLLIIGTAAEEGSRSPEPRSDNPTKVDNYTQIFKTTVEASGTWGSSANVTSEHDWNLQRRKQANEHKKDIEYAFLFGKPATATGANGKPRRFTGGIKHYLDQNTQDAGGTLTEAEWETWMRSGFRYGTGTKTVIASPLVISVLNAYALGKYQVVNDKATTYGVNVMNLVSAHGSVNLVEHKLLEGAVYGGYAFMLDTKGAGLKYRYLDGGPFGSRDTKLLTNRQESDRDGRRDEWISEVGLQVGHAKHHAVLYNVTG